MPHAHHLQIDDSHLAGNAGIGRYILLPGSVGRAERLAERLSGATRHTNRRRLDVFLGRLGEVDVAVIPTGMGCPSVDIVVGELLTLGARRLLRVGTSGSLQPQVRIGDLVIASAAVRDEAASDAYTDREYPAVGCPVFVGALADAALAAGLGSRVHVGIVHSKDSFFGREFGHGPDGERNRAYMERLHRAGVLASEMEAAHLFVLGSVARAGHTDVIAWRGAAAPVRCAALLAVIGTVEAGIASLAEEEAAEERLMAVGLGGIAALAAREAPPA